MKSEGMLAVEIIEIDSQQPAVLEMEKGYS